MLASFLLAIAGATAQASAAAIAPRDDTLSCSFFGFVYLNIKSSSTNAPVVTPASGYNLFITEGEVQANVDTNATGSLLGFQICAVGAGNNASSQGIFQGRFFPTTSDQYTPTQCLTVQDDFTTGAHIVPADCATGPGDLLNRQNFTLYGGSAAPPTQFLDGVQELNFDYKLSQMKDGEFDLQVFEIPEDTVPNYQLSSPEAPF